jgi:anti-anti-sigma factor
MTACEHLVITARLNGRAWVLSLTGDLDVTSKEQLRAAVRVTLASRPEEIALDLSALKYADCAGLAVLTWAHYAQVSRQRQLRIVGCRGAVLRLMEITGVKGILYLDRG